MQTLILRHKLHLHRRQASFLIVGLFLLSTPSFGQYEAQTNLPDYDNRVLHFGFTIGAHQSAFRITHDESFVGTGLDSLHSIAVNNSIGFSIGFLANFHILQYLDLRPMFKVSFYEYDLDYHFIEGETIRQTSETAYLELPLTVKYRSLRRGNFGMYLVGGITPGLQVGGRDRDDRDPDVLHLQRENLSLEYGIGVDLYYPLFKFSPEIRVSHGIRNMVRPGISDFSNGIDRLVTHSVSLYLNFQ